MKIITLHQPWASLIALGLKRYETRHWSTSYRGPLLIHAAKHPMKYEEKRLWQRAVDLARESGTDLPPEKVPFVEKLPYGQIVAIADLSDCLKMWQLQNLHGICINDQTELERSVGLWQPGRFALRLDNVRPLPNPIPFKSRQGKLLDAPPDIVDMLCVSGGCL